MKIDLSIDRCGELAIIRNYWLTLISSIPSKNTILSTEILRKCANARDLAAKALDSISELIKKDEELRQLILYLQPPEDQQDSQPPRNCNRDLLEFMEENSIDIVGSEDVSEQINQLRKDIKETVKEYRQRLNIRKEFSIEWFKNFLEEIGDNIFYTTEEFTRIEDMTLHTLDAVEDCGKWISENANFKAYQEIFFKQIKIHLLLLEYKQPLNAYFETAFNDNDFERLFPLDGYGKLLEEILRGMEFDELKQDAKTCLIDHADTVVWHLPFFKMCIEFRNILQKGVYVQTGKRKGLWYMKFNSDPISNAIFNVGTAIERSQDHMGLSDDFYTKYILRILSESQEPILDLIRAPSGSIQATNWSKLVYHYTRREEACFFCDLNFDPKFLSNINPISAWESIWTFFSSADGTERNNPFYWRESLIKYIGKNYHDYKRDWYEWQDEWYGYDSAYKIAMDGEDKDFDPRPMLQEMGHLGEPMPSDLVEEFEENQKKLNYVLESAQNLRRKLKFASCMPPCCESLFHHYFFTESGDLRTHAVIPIAYSPDLSISDIWTQGIIKELYPEPNIHFNTTYGDFLDLPKEYRDISIFPLQ